MREAFWALVLSLAVAGGLAAVQAGHAEEAEAAGAEATPEVDGWTLYQTRTCIACHGKDAKTPILPEYPKLAGQNAAYTFQQMKDIKSGARANGNTEAMRGVMHLVSEPEMKVLSDYLAGLEP